MGRLIKTILKELKEHVGWINSIFNNVLVCFPATSEIF